MIKNKAAQAFVIGTCLMLSSTLGVYADVKEVPDRPIAVENVNEEDLMYTTTMVELRGADDSLLQIQQEIDKYVFEEHADEIAQKGFTVTNTGVMGDFVEIGITPYDQKNVDYLYEIFGTEKVKVVEGTLAVPLDLVTVTAVKDEAPEASFFSRIFTSIVEWFKSIF